jgi:NTP pyrophosphatase (non-canonical NTP hydrolase)
MRSFNELRGKTIQWAKDKEIIKPENAHKQALKMVSEVGEVCDELLKDDLEAFKNELGDVQVTLIILAQQKGVNLTECLQLAYNKISKRQGKTIDGIFIKD